MFSLVLAQDILNISLFLLGVLSLLPSYHSSFFLLAVDALFLCFTSTSFISLLYPLVLPEPLCHSVPHFCGFCALNIHMSVWFLRSHNSLLISFRRCLQIFPATSFIRLLSIQFHFSDLYSICSVNEVKHANIAQKISIHVWYQPLVPFAVSLSFRISHCCSWLLPLKKWELNV